MSWTADEIEAEWLTPAGEALVRPADMLVQAVCLAEQIRGRDWVLGTTHLANGGRALGFMLSLSKVVSFGSRVSAVVGVPGSEELLDRLRQRDPAAESELTAIYLLRGGRPDISLEIGPTVAVGNREKRPDFRIRRHTEPWTYVEVTQLRESGPSARTRQLLGRIAQSILALERTFIVEIILDREPLAGEDEDIVQRTCELCISGAELQTRIEGLATILLKTGAANIVETSPEENPVPRMALTNSVFGPGAENRQVIVRVPFVDTRAEEILTAEARQLPKSESALVMVDVAGQPTAFNAWPGLVARRFTPQQHTRVSGLCMFMVALHGMEFAHHVNLIANPHAAVEAPEWIATAIEAYREECRRRFGRPD